VRDHGPRQGGSHRRRRGLDSGAAGTDGTCPTSTRHDRLPGKPAAARLRGHVPESVVVSRIHQSPFRRVFRRPWVAARPPRIWRAPLAANDQTARPCATDLCSTPEMCASKPMGKARGWPARRTAAWVKDPPLSRSSWRSLPVGAARRPHVHIGNDRIDGRSRALPGVDPDDAVRLRDAGVTARPGSATSIRAPRPCSAGGFLVTGSIPNADVFPGDVDRPQNRPARARALSRCSHASHSTGAGASPLPASTIRRTAYAAAHPQV